MKATKFVAEIPTVLIALTFTEKELDQLENFIGGASAYFGPERELKEQLLKIIAEGKNFDKQEEKVEIAGGEPKEVYPELEEPAADDEPPL